MIVYTDASGYHHHSKCVELHGKSWITRLPLAYSACWHSNNTTRQRVGACVEHRPIYILITVSWTTYIVRESKYFGSFKILHVLYIMGSSLNDSIRTGSCHSGRTYIPENDRVYVESSNSSKCSEHNQECIVFLTRIWQQMAAGVPVLKVSDLITQNRHSSEIKFHLCSDTSR